MKCFSKRFCQGQTLKFLRVLRNSNGLNLGNNSVYCASALHFARKIKLMRLTLILNEFSIPKAVGQYNATAFFCEMDYVIYVR